MGSPPFLKSHQVVGSLYWHPSHKPVGYPCRLPSHKPVGSPHQLRSHCWQSARGDGAGSSWWTVPCPLCVLILMFPPVPPFPHVYITLTSPFVLYQVLMCHVLLIQCPYLHAIALVRCFVILDFCLCVFPQKSDYLLACLVSLFASSQTDFGFACLVLLT